MSSTIINLLTNEVFAESIVNSYIEWSDLASPFKTEIGGSLYATTGKMLSLINKENTKFVINRSHFSSLFIDLGSLRLEDTTLRGQIIKDARLRVSWFHNARSVSLSLLSHQPLFNAFLGYLGDKLHNRYTLGWLQEELKNEQLRVSERSKLLRSAKKLKKVS